MCYKFSNTTVNTQKTSKTQPRAVFRAHFDQLVDGVNQQSDIIMLTAKLYSKGLISEHFKNDITTTTGVSSSQKSMDLVNAIEKRIKVDQRPVELMKELCEVMQQYPTLVHVAESISKELGELMNVYNCKCVKCTQEMYRSGLHACYVNRIRYGSAFNSYRYFILPLLFI